MVLILQISHKTNLFLIRDVETSSRNRILRFALAQLILAYFSSFKCWLIANLINPNNSIDIRNMSNDFYKKLGQKIYRLRREMKLSREKFAELAEINDYYLGEIERGEKKASLDILFKISAKLGLEIHELLCLK